MRILIVDDEVGIQRAVGRLLRAVSEVTARGSVTSAIEVLQTETFDVVLLDAHLNDGRNAFDTVCSVRAAVPRGTRVVVVTGGLDPDERRLAYDLGLPILEKPFTRAELLGVIAVRPAA